MARALDFDAYKAALDEATSLIARHPEPASTQAERLDALLHTIAEFPPLYRRRAEALDGSSALAARLRADMETLVRRRAKASVNSAFPPREHGVGPTLGQ